MFFFSLQAFENTLKSWKERKITLKHQQPLVDEEMAIVRHFCESVSGLIDRSVKIWINSVCLDVTYSGMFVSSGRIHHCTPYVIVSLSLPLVKET